MSIPSDTISLRDYFAAHAPIGFDAALDAYGAAQLDQADWDPFMVLWAYMRYQYADAMLAERDKDKASGTSP